MKIARCKHCGSSDVTQDALAAWEEDAQQWRVTSVLDNSDCNACGGEDCVELVTPEHFEVQQLIGQEWTNAWLADDVSQTFATKREAETELDNHMADQLDALRHGEVQDIVPREHFRIAGIGEKAE